MFTSDKIFTKGFFSTAKRLIIFLGDFIKDLINSQDQLRPYNKHPFILGAGHSLFDRINDTEIMK